MTRFTLPPISERYRPPQGFLATNALRGVKHISHPIIADGLFELGHPKVDFDVTMFSISAVDRHGFVLWQGWFKSERSAKRYYWALQGYGELSPLDLPVQPSPCWFPQIHDFGDVLYAFTNVSVTTSTGTTTFTPSSQWNNANNLIEGIGGGDSGVAAVAAALVSYFGGGGADYASSQNITLTPSVAVTIRVGSGGATATVDATGNPGTSTRLFDNGSTLRMEALNGAAATAGCTGNLNKFKGGAGGGAVGNDGGGGGGAAAGPAGAGADGATRPGNTNGVGALGGVSAGVVAAWTGGSFGPGSGAQGGAYGADAASPGSLYGGAGGGGGASGGPTNNGSAGAQGIFVASFTPVPFVPFPNPRRYSYVRR